LRGGARASTHRGEPARLVVLVGAFLLSLGAACRPRDEATTNRPTPVASTPSAAPAPADGEAALPVDGASPASRQAESILEACDALAATFCTREQRCARLSFQLEYVDEAQCLLARRTSCLLEARAPGSGTTRDTLSACTGALAKRPCGLWNDFGDMNIPECHPSGTEPIGAGCRWGTQCGSGLCTADETGLESSGLAGAPIDSTKGSCVENADTHPDLALRAFNEGRPLVACPHGEFRARVGCMPIFYPGQACWTSAFPYDPCFLSTCMLREGPGNHGVCERRGGGCEEHEEAPGAPKCGSWGFCEAGACRNATVVGVGARCDDERLRCGGGARCVWRIASDAEKPTGVCVRRPQEREACSAQMGCVEPFQCEGGRCVMPALE
jgi:hypothetical protein